MVQKKRVESIYGSVDIGSNSVLTFLTFVFHKYDALHIYNLIALIINIMKIILHINRPII